MSVLLAYSAKLLKHAKTGGCEEQVVVRNRWLWRTGAWLWGTGGCEEHAGGCEEQVVVRNRWLWGTGGCEERFEFIADKVL